MRPAIWTTLPPPISAPRSRGAPTSGCGSSKPTPSHADRLRRRRGQPLRGDEWHGRIEHDLRDGLHRFGSPPVALEFADELNPTGGLSAGLDDALEPGAMRLERRAPDRVHDRIHLVSVADRIQCGKGKTGLGPECRHHELPPPG